jgi:hypothetical protein
LPSRVSPHSSHSIQKLLFNPFPDRRRSEKLLKFAFPLEMTYFIRDRERREERLDPNPVTLLDFQASLLDVKHFPSVTTCPLAIL